jgi:uncharacterized protein (DUF58 family)
MSISGLFGKANLSKVALDIEFPEEIFAETKFPVRVTLRNERKSFPSFLIRARIGDHTTLFPFVDAGAESSRYITLSMPTRGHHEISGVYVYSVFPFNFFTRFKTLRQVYQFVVFPRLRRCDLLSLFEKERNARGEKSSDMRGYEADIISIRKYVRGDPIKYINWKATAKTGKLKTKELSSTVFQPLTIDFDKVLINDLEEKISCIAYTILQLLRKNVPVGLRVKDAIYPPEVSNSHKIGMLRELALFSPFESTETSLTNRPQGAQPRPIVHGRTV